ncbi:Transcription factor AP-4 [Trichinella pseudospiralis]|uniref:Transcription factor AP-4 n=1 Tax=Trichinella pseudospiralis TaxID=6337 RepID=A0A0V1KBM6_TRIPS|nr:Transcription factor AP-4 [Trichinella pseudospiralis]
MKNANDQRCQLDIEDNDENDDCSDPDYESKVRVCNKSSTPMKESTGSNSVPPNATAAAAAAAAAHAAAAHVAAAAAATTTTVTTKHHGRHHRLDPEKRLRREIANSNERRRMQSINAGFQALKAMLPRREEEKMSKAAILQQTAEHVHSLNCKVADMTKKLVKLQKACDSKGSQAEPLLEEGELVDVGVQTSQSLLNENNKCPEAMAGVGGGSSRKRLRSCRGSDSAGIVRPISKSSVACQTDFTDNTSVEFKYMKHQIIELRIAYDNERQLRLLREKQYRSLEMNHFNSLSQVSGVSMLDFPVNGCHQAALLPVGSGFAPAVQVPFSAPAAVVTSSLPTVQSPFLTVSQAAESANVVHVSPQTSGTQGMPSAVFGPSALAAVSAMLSPTTVSVSGWNAAAAAAHSSDSAGCFSSSFANISVAAAAVAAAAAAAAPPPPPPPLPPPPPPATLAVANHGNFLNSGQVTVPHTKGLGSIIDAVRLLEGDHLFNDEQPSTEENNTKADNTAAASSCCQKEMSNNFPKREPPSDGQCSL